MLDFKINQFLSLSLQNERTLILVNGQEFIQCKSVLINISSENFYEFEDLNSIDQTIDVSNLLNTEQKTVKYNLTAEEEFWVHCSNLQAWCEHDYDTHLLHSNLAFPLLKKLSEVGDPMAKRVFKEEIAIRLEENYAPINELFIEEGFLNYLSEREIDACCPKGLNVDKLILSSRRLTGIPSLIERLPIQALRSLNLINNHFSTFPSFILKNVCLEVLLLKENLLKHLPESISNLSKLKEFDLSDNMLMSLPTNIGKLFSLKSLNLYGNNLLSIPESIGNLASLKKLVLANNKLQELPASIGKLINLEHLSLRSNQLSSLPSSLDNLINLKSLDLSNNKFHSPSSVQFVNMLNLRVARNNAQFMIRNAEKFLSSNNSITSEQRSKILRNVENLKEIIESDDYEEIYFRTHKLTLY